MQPKYYILFQTVTGSQDLMGSAEYCAWFLVNRKRWSTESLDEALLLVAGFREGGDGYTKYHIVVEC